jgi:ParB-like chromosome segregation protein Spo0J
MGFDRSWCSDTHDSDTARKKKSATKSPRLGGPKGYARSWVNDSDGGPRKKRDPNPTKAGGAMRLEQSRVGHDGGGDDGERPGKKIRFDVIVPDPDVVPYPRVHIGNTTQLARRITDDGLKQPLLVWENEGEYILVDGFRRYAALERVKATNRQFWRKEFEEVEVEIVEGSLTDVLVAQARANLEDRSWNDGDFACACAMLVDTGLTTVEIAEKTGESTARILDALDFQRTAVDELLKAVADGFAYEKALDLARKPQELQMFAVECFRQGRPKRKEPRPPTEKPLFPTKNSLTPRRRKNGALHDALDKVEQQIELLVNGSLAAKQSTEDFIDNGGRGLGTYMSFSEQLAELRATRHGLLWTLGRRHDLLNVSDPVKSYQPGRRSDFRMPSWRDEN